MISSNELFGNTSFQKIVLSLLSKYLQVRYNYVGKKTAKLQSQIKVNSRQINSKLKQFIEERNIKIINSSQELYIESL